MGIVALLVYSFLYAILAETTRFGAVPISIIAYSTGAAFSFVGHKYVTFRAAGNVRSQLFRFIAIHCLCLFTTAAITGLVVDQLRWPYGIGILLVDIVIPVLSFLALKFVVFEVVRPPG